MTARARGHAGLLARACLGILTLLAASNAVRAGFIPTDVSGCRLWLDASDAATLWQDTAGTVAVTANGQAVARWDDKSGNSFSVSQATAANRPQYSAGSLYGSSTLHIRWVQ